MKCVDAGSGNGEFGVGREGAEVALDAVRIPHADLNMVLFLEPGIGVEVVAFPEGRADRVEGGQFLDFSRFVQEFYYSVIQVSQYQIGT